MFNTKYYLINKRYFVVFEYKLVCSILHPALDLMLVNARSKIYE